MAARNALIATFVLLGLVVGVMTLRWDRGGQPVASDIVATPLEGSEEVAVFLRIDNPDRPDRILAASSPLGVAEVYAPESKGGLPLPVGSGLQFAADGAHFRLLPRAPLLHGQLVPLTLTLAEAGAMSMKARVVDPSVAGDASKVGLFGLGDICRVEDGEPAPRISLRVAQNGAGWQITVDAQDFTFSEDLLGLYHVPGTGHGHLYVGGVKLGRLFAPEAQIGALPPGRHIVRITLNTNDHRAYVVGDMPVTASAEIIVE
jgi:copper(I)-binding protein